MKAGDIYLVHESGVTDRVIQRATGSNWNHAGVVTSAGGDTIEAEGRGIVVDTLTRHDPSRIRIVDTGLTDDQRAIVVRTAQGFVGNRYGWLSVVAAGINVAWQFPLILGADKSPDCFVLTAHCLFHAGVDLPKDDERMTGRDLALLFGVVPC